MIFVKNVPLLNSDYDLDGFGKNVKLIISAFDITINYKVEVHSTDFTLINYSLTSFKCLSKNITI